MRRWGLAALLVLAVLAAADADLARHAAVRLAEKLAP